MRDALAGICRDHAAIALDDLQLDRLGSFLALRPEHTPAALGALADDCVRRLRVAARRQFGALPPLRLERRSVFIEPRPGAEFVLLEQRGLSA